MRNLERTRILMLGKTLDFGLRTGSVSLITGHGSVDEVAKWAGAFKDDDTDK